MGLAGIGVDHLVAIAVVCCQQYAPAALQAHTENTVALVVDGFHGPDDGIAMRRVPDHVRIGEVGDNEILGAMLDGADQLVGDLRGAHLGLHVVGCHLG